MQLLYVHIEVCCAYRIVGGYVEQNDGIRLTHIWMYHVMDSPERYISIPLLLETNIYSWGKWILYSVKLCANVCLVEGSCMVYTLRGLLDSECHAVLLM